MRINEVRDVYNTVHRQKKKEDANGSRKCGQRTRSWRSSWDKIGQLGSWKRDGMGIGRISRESLV
ncbi:hypothetical protein BD626DRAFT_490014 [Schizophyllum amplum]|uniref:Uncharacterized protein n=1 Tax=Schizophyllum amplum TaxID=97359 RepID=A0A550CJ70_9AGAR|nr:hypothetical protein BD626DRAFT_490014 [Auriculariopsis ampla]